MARELLDREVELPVRTCGGSMAPWLRPDDRIVVQRAAAGEARPGDIVLFERDGRLVAHRVIACIGSGAAAVLRTIGDACRTADPPTPWAAVLGRVTAVVRPDGRRCDLAAPRWRAVAILYAWRGRLADALRGGARRLRRRRAADQSPPSTSCR